MKMISYRGICTGPHFGILVETCKLPGGRLALITVYQSPTPQDAVSKRAFAQFPWPGLRDRP